MPISCGMGRLRWQPCAQFKPHSPMKLSRFLIVGSVLAFVLQTFAAPIFETVAEFEFPPRAPFSTLTRVGDCNYYGTTSNGGHNALGTVF